MNSRLDSLIDGTLDWLSDNLKFFVLPSKAEDEKQEEVVIDPQRKALGELAVGCMLMSRYPKIKSRKAFNLCVEHAAGMVGAPDYRFDMMRRLNLFPAYVVDTATLEACGKGFPENRFAIQRHLDSGFMDAIERTPWNQIDLKYYLDCGGFRHNLPDFKSLFRRSIASRLPPIPCLRIIDVYAFTHILFHIGDFGRRDLRPILGGGFDAIREQVALLLGVYTYAKDCDLAAELIMCCYCLRYRPSPLFELALELILEAQTPAGDIPYKAPGPESKEPRGPHTPDSHTAGAARFKANYHATLVALFASMMARYEGEPL